MLDPAQSSPCLRVLPYRLHFHIDSPSISVFSGSPVLEAGSPRGLPRTLGRAEADHARPAAARCCAALQLGSAPSRSQLLVVSERG